MAVAAPIIMAAVSAYSANRARKQSQKIADVGQTPTPQELAATEGGMGAAGELGDLGKLLSGQGIANVGQASDYYQKLLGRGGKEAALAAVGPQMGNISQIYSGVSRGLEGRNVRGGVKDLALARSERDKAGSMSRLIHGVQPAAAGALANIGTTLTGQGAGAMQGAGGIFSRLAGIGLGGRQTGLQGQVAGSQMGTQWGEGIGGIIMQLLQGIGTGGGGGGGGGYQPPKIGTPSPYQAGGYPT